MNQNTIEMQLQSKNVEKQKTYVGQHMLAFISGQSILKLNIFRKKLVQYNDVLILCNRYGCIVSEEEQKQNPFGILIRLSQNQFPFQEGGSYHFARGYYLLKEVSARSGYESPLDLEKVFKEWCELSIDDFYIIAWCVFCAGYEKNPVFSIEWFINHSINDLKEVLTKENIEKFLKTSSLTIAKL
ncbi:MAG: hypothetical protein ACI9F2_001119, partial [Lysobacterales bacterium]